MGEGDGMFRGNGCYSNELAFMLFYMKMRHEETQQKKTIYSLYYTAKCAKATLSG